ncbi:ankyrin repeat domain-containing protein 50-like [Saccostrea cucullata]|uniref:ankyrin repeat domain-containing protein 50-like n=1 Tax=Saccostrea cuccullata TaxID=36930 RepID=UPI002ED34609
MKDNFIDVVLCPSFRHCKIQNIFIKRIFNMDNIQFQEMFLTTTYPERSIMHSFFKAAFVNNKYVLTLFGAFIQKKEQSLDIVTPEKSTIEEDISFNNFIAFFQQRNFTEETEGAVIESMIERLMDIIDIDMILDKIQHPDPKEFKQRLKSIVIELLKLLRMILNDPVLMQNFQSLDEKIQEIMLRTKDTRRYIDSSEVSVKEFSITNLLNLKENNVKSNNYFLYCIWNMSAEQAFQCFCESTNCFQMTMNMMEPFLRKRIWSFIRDITTVLEEILQVVNNYFSKDPSSSNMSPFYKFYIMFNQILQKEREQTSCAKEICLIREIDKNLRVAETNKHSLALLAHEISPFQMYIIYGDKKIIEALLKRIDRIENGRTMISKSVFLAACLNGSVQVARLILDLMGESVLYQKWFCNDCSSLNALQIASLLHHSEMIAFLLKYKFPVNCFDVQGNTPLTMAITSFHKCMSENERQRGVATLKILLKHGASTSIRNSNGATPFHVACDYIDDRCILELFCDENVNNLTDSGTSPLMLAARNGNTDIVCLLLQQNALVNHHDQAWLYPIHYACLSGSLETVICLFDHGAILDVVENKGITPLHSAAFKGHDDIVKFLLSKKCSVNQNDINLNTALHFAAAYGHLNVVKTLLKNGANVNHVNKGLETPVFYAALQGHYMVAKELINFGAEINKCSCTGRSPLMQAALNNHTNLIELLLESGSNVNGTDAYTRNAVWISASEGHEEITSLLLERKADFHIRDKNGFTPLTIAAKNGKLEIVSLLQQHGCDLNEYAANNNTPLMLAAGEGHNDVVCYLLSYNADINMINERKENALWIASANGHEDIVKILIDEGSDVTQNIEEIDPLYAAAEKGYTEIVDYLLFSGAIENISEFKVDDALMVAALRGQSSVVKILIKATGDINCQDAEGKTALRHAVCGGSIDVVNILLDNSANVNVSDHSEVTPLMVACSKRQGKIIAELLRKGAFFTILIIVSMEKTTYALRNVGSIFHIYFSKPPTLPSLMECFSVKDVLTMLPFILEEVEIK